MHIHVIRHFFLADTSKQLVSLGGDHAIVRQSIIVGIKIYIFFRSCPGSERCIKYMDPLPSYTSTATLTHGPWTAIMAITISLSLLMEHFSGVMRKRAFCR